MIPKPEVFEKVPPVFVDIPSPICNVPPVILPVASETAVPPAAACGLTIVIVPPLQLKFEPLKMYKIGVPVARFPAP